MPRQGVGTLYARYKRVGVLFDANLLLLYWIAKFAPEQVSRFKRTSAFTEEDVGRVVRLYERCSRVVATPNVVTEVSNLAGQLTDATKRAVFEAVRHCILVCSETYVASSVASAHADFPRLGLTDCSILSLPPGSCLVITKDLQLYLSLQRAGIDSINYNHLRSGDLLS